MEAAGVGSVDFDANFEDSQTQPISEDETEDEDVEPSWEDVVGGLADYQAQLGIQKEDDRKSDNRSVPAAVRAAAKEASGPSSKAAARRAKETKEQILLLPEGLGSIRYNPKTKKMIAHCANAAHGLCRRERTCCPRDASAPGRPLGLLGAWLQQSSQHKDRQSHVFVCSPSIEERRQARAMLHGLSGSAAFFDKEKECVDGADSEPEDVT